MMVQVILDEVAKEFGIGKFELMNKTQLRQEQKVVEAKQVAAYLIWRHTRYTLEQIAHTLGYPSKANVNKSKKAVKEIASANRALRQQLEKIEKLILRD